MFLLFIRCILCTDALVKKKGKKKHNVLWKRHKNKKKEKKDIVLYRRDLSFSNMRIIITYAFLQYVEFYSL